MRPSRGEGINAARSLDIVVYVQDGDPSGMEMSVSTDMLVSEVKERALAAAGRKTNVGARWVLRNDRGRFLEESALFVSYPYSDVRRLFLTTHAAAGG